MQACTGVHRRYTVARVCIFLCDCQGQRVQIAVSTPDVLGPPLHYPAQHVCNHEDVGRPCHVIWDGASDKSGGENRCKSRIMRLGGVIVQVWVCNEIGQVPKDLCVQITMLIFAPSAPPIRRNYSSSSPSTGAKT